MTLHQVSLTDVWAMLEYCAPGHNKVRCLHHWRITYAGNTYPTLPTGTKLSKGFVEAGHVRKMARRLGILECAKERLDI